jgi:hypothetical protein
MNPSNAWLTVIIGILLVLNMAGVIDILSSWAGWTLAILVVLAGVVKLVKVHKK